MSSSPRLILASASPRRRQILGILRIPFDAIAVDVDETPRPGEAPEALARRLAVAKAEAGLANRPDALVLGADTVVELDGESLGKPSDAAEAFATLRRLRGSRHRVITGVALASSEHDARSRLTTTEVWMRSYTDAEIEEYVASGDPFDKAGSYAVQHPTFRPVERIAGCFLNVVGLPLPEIVDLLGEAGIGSKVNRPALEAACPGCLEKEMLTGSS